MAAARVAILPENDLRFLVNWQQVGTDKLGICESLLELHPHLRSKAAHRLSWIPPPVTRARPRAAITAVLPGRLPARRARPVVDAAVAKAKRRSRRATEPEGLRSGLWLRALRVSRSPPRCASSAASLPETMTQARPLCSLPLLQSSVSASSASIETPDGSRAVQGGVCGWRPLSQLPHQLPSINHIHSGNSSSARPLLHRDSDEAFRTYRGAMTRRWPSVWKQTATSVGKDRPR